KELRALQARLQVDELRHAVAANEKAVQQAERDWMLRMNFGQLLTEAGQPVRAVENYLAALRILPHCYPAHYKLGRLYLQMGELPEAVARFRTALAFDPEYAE